MLDGDMTKTLVQRRRIETATDGGVAPVFREVARLVADPNTSTSRLAAVVAKDRRLVTTILKKANSSYYYSGKEVTDVGFAVTLLGYNTLRETVASVVVSEVFRRAVTSVVRFEEFWNHSIACALIARAIAERFATVDPGEAFVAGLLHDTGILVMEELPAAVSPSHHAEAGSRLAEQWGLGPAIVQAIKWHHEPGGAVDAWPLAAVVHVADLVSVRIHPGHPDADMPSAPHPEALRLFGLDEHLTGTAVAAFAAGLDLSLSGAPSFEELVLSIRQKLIERVQQLAPDKRLIFILYYYEGLSLEEIGSLVGSSEDTARILLESALGQLRDTIFHDVAIPGPMV